MDSSHLYGNNSFKNKPKIIKKELANAGSINSSQNDSSSALTIMTVDYEQAPSLLPIKDTDVMQSGHVSRNSNEPDSIEPQQTTLSTASTSIALSDSRPPSPGIDQSIIRYKTYKKRYFLLVIFITLSMTNAFHWIEYAIIESIVHQYYKVSIFWINSTSVIFMINYIIGIIPATYILDRFGLRVCLIIGSFLNAFGSWVKVLSIGRKFFWIAMIGQTITASAQLFILNIPPILAATWFPAQEVTHATAFGVFGNQVGIALGFLIPPLMMPNLSENGTNSNNDLDDQQLEHIHWGLLILSITLSLITTTIFLLIVIFFRNRPKEPPSQAQAFIRDMELMNTKLSYFESIVQLITNSNFDLLFLSYGLNAGVFYALSTVLSQMITKEMGQHFLQEAGYMGLTLTLSGILGSVICGYILGWSGRYKLVTLIVYFFSLIGTAAFTTAIRVKSVLFLFSSCALLGFFMTGYLPIGFEFAAEVSYPQPEGTSAGLLNAAAQIFGIIFTYSSSPLIERFGSEWTCIGFLVVLIFGFIMTMLVKSQLLRQNAQLQRPQGQNYQQNGLSAPAN